MHRIALQQDFNYRQLAQRIGCGCGKCLILGPNDGCSVCAARSDEDYQLS
jgi:hypothetical protein